MRRHPPISSWPVPDLCLIARTLPSHRLTGLTAAITALPDAADKSDGKAIAGLIDGAAFGRA